MRNNKKEDTLSKKEYRQILKAAIQYEYSSKKYKDEGFIEHKYGRLKKMIKAKGSNMIIFKFNKGNVILKYQEIAELLTNYIKNEILNAL